MEGVNLCEISNCGNTVIVFGLKGGQKTRACKEHVAALLEKRMQIIDIEGYNFISTLSDVVAFDERKTLAEKGRGNLAVLEATCNNELEEALSAIENARKKVLKSVENRLEEMRAMVTMTCNVAKRQLSLLETDFRQFLSTPDSQLSPTARIMCSDLTAMPRIIKFSVGEVADDISAVLSDSWTAATPDIHCILRSFEPSLKDTATLSAVNQAKKGISDALHFVHFDNKSFEEVSDKVTTELLRFEKERIERNLGWLQRSWDWRQQCAFSDDATIEVGQHLAVLLSRQLGRFPEAEQLLEFCYDIEQARSSASEHSMSLCIDICGVYFDSAQYEKAEELGVWMLTTFGTADFPAECYWAALLYATYSKRRQSKHREANALLENWRQRELRQDTNLAELLRSLTCGIGAHWSGNKGEAEKQLYEAKRIGTIHFPTSPFTAFTLFRLTLLCQGNAREQLHRQAQSIYEVSAPASIDAATNLYNFGLFLDDMKRWEEAEDCYRKAQASYHLTAPNSAYAAKNLYNLGSLLMAGKRWSEAEECYKQAQSIYETAGPKSVDAALNLYSLGTSLRNLQRWSAAEDCYQRAKSTYEVAAPRSIDAAKNLSSMGALLTDMERLKEAEVCYRQAQAIYEAADPKSVPAADNYQHMGELFKAMKNTAQAVECFAKAAKIYAENGQPPSKPDAEEKTSLPKDPTS